MAGFTRKTVGLFCKLRGEFVTTPTRVELHELTGTGSLAAEVGAAWCPGGYYDAAWT